MVTITEYWSFYDDGSADQWQVYKDRVIAFHAWDKSPIWFNPFMMKGEARFLVQAISGRNLE